MIARLAIAAALVAILSAPAVADDALTVAAPWEVVGADPAVSGFAFQRMQVAETLVEADAQGHLLPGLAEAWTVSDDGLEWRFRVRSGVTFHDGSVLSAQAASRSLARAVANPGVLESARIRTVRADDGDVVVELTAPFSALPALLTHSTAVILAPASYAADGSVTTAIGTGPYRLVELAPPQSMRLEAFDGYWGPPPHIRETLYLAAGRAETRALLAESGDAALVFTLDPPGFSRLSANAAVTTLAEPIPRVVMLKVNAAHPLLMDPRMRQALSLAIDRAGIATGILRAPDTAATQLFPPALGDWHIAGMAPLRHDPGEAARLLAGLGFAPGPDGVLVRDGERLALTLRTFPDRPELPLIATAIQDQWRAIGIELVVSIGNFSEIPAGHQDGSLEVALFARHYGLTPDPIGTALTDFGTGGGDWGAMGWDRPDVVAALDAIALTTEPGARAPRIALVVEALQADLPVIPITWHRQTAAIDRRLEGVVVDPLERSYRLSQIRWRD